AARPRGGQGLRRADRRGDHADHQREDDREVGAAVGCEVPGGAVRAAARGGRRRGRRTGDRRRGRLRAERPAARRGRAWPALLHAEQVPGHPRDLPPPGPEPRPPEGRLRPGKPHRREPARYSRGRLAPMTAYGSWEPGKWYAVSRSWKPSER